MCPRRARQEWREHKAAAEERLVDDARRRATQRKTLAAHVRKSMLDALPITPRPDPSYHPLA